MHLKIYLRFSFDWLLLCYTRMLWRQNFARKYRIINYHTTFEFTDHDEVDKSILLDSE
jgi:hypothetical protein